MTNVTPFTRTLDQELVALLRGLSMECLVCGEFVLKTATGLFCPECGSGLVDESAAAPGLQLPTQAG